MDCDPDELRSKIRQCFEDAKIREQIKEILETLTTDENNGIVYEENPLAQGHKILQVLRQRGVVESLVKSISLKPIVCEIVQAEKSKKVSRRSEKKGCGNSHPSGVLNQNALLSDCTETPVIEKNLLISETRVARGIKVYIGSGRCFTESLCTEVKDLDIFIDLYFGNAVHRFSHASYCTEPNFNEEVVISFNSIYHKKKPSYDVEEPGKLRLVVVEENVVTGVCRAISSQCVDWVNAVSVDCQLKTPVALELLGVGDLAGTTVGILDISLEVYPSVSHLESWSLPDSHIIRDEKKFQRFIHVANIWWNDYIHIREGNRQRIVKVFATDENGKRKPVSHFLCDIASIKYFDTPSLAARFVSLFSISETSMSSAGYGGTNGWMSSFSFCSIGIGSSESHALLLCSLLLGFGLDAYVSLGTKRGFGKYAWVSTFNSDGEVTFWDAVCGQKYRHGLPGEVSPSHPFLTLDSLFNKKYMLANCQPSNCCTFCHFQLGNPVHWKKLLMESESIATLPLLKPVPFSNYIDLASEVKGRIEIIRRSKGLSCVWDDQLDEVLFATLYMFENQRRSLENHSDLEQFRETVKRRVPDGHTFLAFPINTSGLSVSRTFEHCLKSTNFTNVLNTGGDEVRISLAIRTFEYPQRIFSTWTMIAVTYKRIS